MLHVSTRAPPARQFVVLPIQGVLLPREEGKSRGCGMGARHPLSLIPSLCAIHQREARSSSATQLVAAAVAARGHVRYPECTALLNAALTPPPTRASQRSASHQAVEGKLHPRLNTDKIGRRRVGRTVRGHIRLPSTYDGVASFFFCFPAVLAAPRSALSRYPASNYCNIGTKLGIWFDASRSKQSPAIYTSYLSRNATINFLEAIIHRNTALHVWVCGNV